MRNLNHFNVLFTRMLSTFLLLTASTLTLFGTITLADAAAFDGDHFQDASGANTSVTSQVVRKGWGFMPGNGKFAIEDTPINYGITFDELPFLIVKFANSKQVADGDPVDLADCSITRNVIAAGVNQTTRGFKPILRTPTGLGFPSATNYCYTWIAIGKHDTSYDGETDPIFSAWNKSTGISIIESQITDLSHTSDTDIAAMGYIKSYTETDPVFSAWDKGTGISITESQISDLNHFTNNDEIDPVFAASDAAGITVADITNWNAAYTWGDHSSQGYLTSFTETDPTVQAGIKDGVDWSETQSGIGVYMDYRPDNTACGEGQVLKYDEFNARWVCADENIKQLVQNFVVTEGESVTAGDVVSFLDGKLRKGIVPASSAGNPFNESANQDYISAAMLSPSKFVIVYRDDGNAYYGTAIIGNVSGTSISWGDEYVFNPGVTNFSSVAALAETKFVAVYEDDSNSSYGTAIIGNVSDTSISWGSEHVFNSGDTNFITVATLTESKLVAIYRDDGNAYHGTAIIGDVIGTTISWGDEYVFNPGITSYSSVAALSGTKLVAVYRDDSNSYYGTAIIGDVSGTSISWGTEHVFNTGWTDHNSVAALSSTKLIITYTDIINFGKAIIGNVSGTSISWGAEHVFYSGETDYSSVAALSSTKLIVTYVDNDNSNYGTAIIGDVSEANISWSSEHVFNSDNTNFPSVADLSDTKFVTVYGNGGNSNYGTAIIGEISGDDIFKGSDPVGIAQASGTEGQTLPVVISGVSGTHSGLSAGTIYYSDELGNLTVSATDWKIGLSISETEMILCGKCSNDFAASAAAGITSKNINNWNRAYGWGDHHSYGYDASNDQWQNASAGDIWLAKESNRQWYSVAMSTDRNIQTSVVNGGQIYVSTDGGDTWVPKESNRLWWDVAMSADGSAQTALVAGGEIYVSTDTGNTWVSKAFSSYWRSVAVSADGTIQIATDGSHLYVSTDTGNTWTSKGPDKVWYSVAMSADGSIQTAVVRDGHIYVSTDTGDTWLPKDSARSWYAVAMSAGGNIQTAVVNGGQIYVSTDTGNTWIAKDSNRNWQGVAISADGSIQTAIVDGGQIYFSSDTGNTWNAKDSNRAWKDITMSADGSIQTAVVYDGQIYVSSGPVYSMAKVGVGTMNPIYTLDVEGSIHATSAIKLNGIDVLTSETDPVFAASDAAGIATTDITNWNTAYSWGDHRAAGYDTSNDAWQNASGPGDTWAPKDSARSWYGIAMSADGSIQTAASSGEQIYISLDSGKTWTPKDSIRAWRSVAMSSDGSIQTAVVYNGQIYISTDTGNTWTAKDSNRRWIDISMSSDGSIQTAVEYNGQIYVSTDTGNTWTAKDSNREWQSVSMSADGSIQAAIVYFGYIYLSQDSGNTWIAKGFENNWNSISISADGSIQTAAAETGWLYVSTDSGNTWVPKGPNNSWRSVAMSADGIIQTAVSYVFQIYVSIDTGNTWSAKNSNRNWRDVAMSADGSIQTAVVYGGQIYVSPAEDIPVYSMEKVGVGTINPQSALHIADGHYLQLGNNSPDAPPGEDCDSDTERGRMFIETTNNRIYICNGETRGWDYMPLTD